MEVYNQNVGLMRLIPLIRSEENYEIVHDVFSDINVTSTLSIVGEGEKITNEVIESFYKTLTVFDKEMNFGMYKIYEKKTGKFIGLVGMVISLKDDDERAMLDNKCEVVYFLKKEFHGKKIGTDLSCYFVKDAFQRCKVQSVFSCALCTNIPSQVILLKSGLKYIKPKRRPNGNVVSYFKIERKDYQEKVDVQYVKKTIEKIKSIDYVNFKFDDEGFSDEFSGRNLKKQIVVGAKRKKDEPLSPKKKSKKN